MPTRSTEEGGYHFVPNLGSAGDEYDLLLGRLPKQGTLGAEFVSEELSIPVPLLPPALVPFAASPRGTGCDASRPLNPAAPMVVLAFGRDSAGEKLDVTTPAGRTIAVAAPLAYESSEWSSNTVLPAYRSVTEVVDADGSNLVVHVLPYRSPFSFQSTTAGANIAASGLVLAEDSRRIARLIMMTINPQGSAAPHTVNITTAPIRGSLFAAGQETPLSSGELLPVLVSSVTYEPSANLYGKRIDSFALRSILLDHKELASAEDTTHVTIKQINDLPTAGHASYFLQEDSPHILNVTLNVNDAESGFPLDIAVTQLPEKGMLYPPHMIKQTEDGAWALAPNATPISVKYNAYSSAGVPVEQWASRVIAVSSFWGNPPGSGYHPIHILGPPDCSIAGECKTEGLWVTDNTKPIPVGQRVQYSGLLAHVIGNNGMLVELDLAPMYKRDESGVLRRCAFNPKGATISYPADCSFELAASRSDLGLTVPRAQVAAIDAGVWCPLHRAEFAGRMVDVDGAFGPQYVYNHSQADGMNADIEWTEFIEVGFDEPVYVLGIELGSPRGSGQVSSIKVRRKGQSLWRSVFWGGVQKAAGDEAAETKQYYRWSPHICRLHMLVDEVRIEVDTSVATGISDWNYLDYVQLIGTTEEQPARLATNTRWLAYVPDAHANGKDSFTYVATDCPSFRLRSSKPAEVSVTIEPANDAPTIAIPNKAPMLEEGGILFLTLPAHDHDVVENGDKLHFIVTALPRVATLLHAKQTASGDVFAGERVRAGDRLARAQAYLRFEQDRLNFDDEKNGACGLTIREAMDYVNSSLTGAAQQSVQQRLLDLHGDLRVCIDEISYDAIDSAGLAANTTYPIVLHKVAAAASQDTFIAIVSAASLLAFLIFVAGVIYGIVRLLRTWRHLRQEAVKRQQSNFARLAYAVSDIFSCKFTVCFVKFSDFRRFGELCSHETVRRAGKLIYLDTYDDVMSFTSKHATLFISHQWVGREHPDPDAVQYLVICQAAEKLLVKHNLQPDDLFICAPTGLDYSSIPQRNTILQALSISTLTLYVSACRYFVIICPTTEHHDTGEAVNLETYQRRGCGCRVELFARIVGGGLADTYYFDEQLMLLTDLPNIRQQWLDDSLAVYRGDFTVEGDKQKLVELLLGFYGWALIKSARNIDERSGSDEDTVVALLRRNREGIFPREYFEDLPATLEAQFVQVAPSVFRFDPDQVLQLEPGQQELRSALQKLAVQEATDGSRKLGKVNSLKHVLAFHTKMRQTRKMGQLSSDSI